MKRILFLAFLMLCVIFAGSPAHAEDEATEIGSGTKTPLAPEGPDGLPVSGWHQDNLDPTAEEAGNARLARVTGCVYGWFTDYATETWGVFGVVDVGVEVRIRNCDGAGATRRAQPIRFDILCRSRNGSAPKSVIHNLYFSDHRGNTYNPHPKTMSCPDRDWSYRRFTVPGTVDWFRRCDAGPPRFVDDYKIDYPGLHGGDIGTLASTFWGFVGPHTWNC